MCCTKSPIGSPATWGINDNRWDFEGGLMETHLEMLMAVNKEEALWEVLVDVGGGELEGGELRGEGDVGGASAPPPPARPQRGALHRLHDRRGQPPQPPPSSFVPRPRHPSTGA